MTNPMPVPLAADSDVINALVKAEAALADIGDADREPGDDLAWCERRAAEALPFVREALAFCTPDFNEWEDQGTIIEDATVGTISRVES